MSDAVNSQSIQERRKYLRLENRLPIDFSIVRLQGDLPGINWQKGSTRDVSEGGICLETADLNHSVVKFLDNEDIFLDLRIHLPLRQTPIKVVGEVAWFDENQGEEDSAHRIGIRFKSIVNDDVKTLMSQVSLINRIIHSSGRMAIIISILVLIVAVMLYFVNL